MNWYEHLYVGEKARKKRYAILQGLRDGKWQPEVYVIMPPRSGNNVLEIVPSVMLQAPPYRDWDVTIAGVAVTYWEALEVAREIVDDLYRKTGGFCLADLTGRNVYDKKELLPDANGQEKNTLRGGIC
jgi:hypothetical protein